MSGTTAEEVAREVEKDMAREKALNFLKKHQTILFFILSAALAAGLSFYIYRYFQENSAVKRGEAYFKALTRFQEGKSAALDPVIADKENPYRYVALIKKLDTAQNSVDPSMAEKIAEESVKEFWTVPAKNAPAQTDQSVGLFRDLVKLRLLYLLQDHLDQKEFDEKTAALVQDDFAFRSSAREIVALRALERGDTKKAEAMLRKIIQDPYAPNTLRERSSLYLQTLNVEKPGAAPVKMIAPTAEKPASASKKP